MRRKRPVIRMPVTTRGRDQRRESIQKLKRSQHEFGLAVAVRLGQHIAHARFGDTRGAGGAVTALPLQSLTGERGPGAVAQQPFECGAILGLDEYARVHREPAAVLPALEISDGIGRQTAVTLGGPQHPMTNRPLHRREVDLTQAGRMKA